MKLNSTCVFICMLIFSQSVFAQYEELKGYFYFPIRPGELNYLSGSMGELRSTHFHGGLDIKTSGTVGLPVYAAADGYISRIKIATGGYGNALYIKHTNGTTSVYAHLQKFKDPIQKYLIKQQYNKKSFTVDLFPGNDDFVVKKGEIIAFSGNSGSSSGPHLHFEIRDANQNILDPSRMGFTELKDNLPPELIKVAFITKGPGARVNGQYGRFEFNAIKKADGTYSINKSMTLNGPIGIEIYAYDKANGTRNKYGIPDLTGTIDDEVFFRQNIRDISYNKMRNILVHTNYQNSVRGGRRFNKLYKDDGNSLNFYSGLRQNGLIMPEKGKPAVIKVKMADPYGNSSLFKLEINKTADVTNDIHTKREMEVIDNMLKVFVADQGDSHLLEVFANNHSYQIPPDYTTRQGSVYLWDLCFGLPDSVDFCTEVKALNYQQSFFPGQKSNFYHPTATISFNKSTLFDTLHLKYQYVYDSNFQKEVFHFKNAEDPLKTNASITLKPANTYDQQYARIYAMYSNGKTSFTGGKWDGDRISFRTRNLVRYTIDYDCVPPTIKPARLTSQKIVMTINDAQSGIESYTGKIDGKWLLLKYDYKRKRLETDPLDPNIPLTGEFELEVKDKTGNTKYFKSKIN
ncbi:MAG: M23 family metallopeptidase [Cyclobacteriaceae bacterium]